MPKQRIVLGLMASVAFIVSMQAPAMSEDYRGTMQQQMACTPDVFRLCSEQIPDTNRIVACLRENTPQLSGGCRAVFDSNASAPQQPAVAPRGRAAVQQRPAVQPQPYQDDDD